MCLAYANLQLRNPKAPDLLPISVSALADTGALHLCIPPHVALQLQLEELQKREVVTADGKKMVCPYVGPVEVSYDGRSCFTGAIILGDEVLLGALPMEDMDIIVEPAKRSVIINPESPNIPLSIAKRATRTLSESLRIMCNHPRLDAVGTGTLESVGAGVQGSARGRDIVNENDVRGNNNATTDTECIRVSGKTLGS